MSNSARGALSRAVNKAIESGAPVYTNIPDVHANDRDIPAGKVLVAEYRDVADDEPRARPETLETRTAWGRTEVKLVAVPAGWAIAGSMLRWDNGWYGTRYEIGGAIHGRRFRTYAEAKTAFDALPA